MCDADIGSGSACFCFSLNLGSAAQYVVYSRLMTWDISLSLNPNWCHHLLITQLFYTLWLINVFSFYFREVPAELAFVLSKMENWEVVNASDKHLGKMSGQVPMMPVAKKKLSTHFTNMFIRGICHFPIFHFTEDKGQFSWHFPKIERKYIY